MSRTAARLVLRCLDAVNAVQPARQRAKTLANLRAALDQRGLASVAVPGGDLRFFVHRGRHVAGAIARFHDDEPETLAWIDTMEPGAVLWDIGASFGQFALYAARGGRQVLAFEPKATSYALLVEHVALNGLGDAVMPLPIALSDATGLSRLMVQNLEAGTAMNALDGTSDQWGRAPEGFTQPVQTLRMDDAPALGLPAPDHLKLDVDGAEAMILRGGPGVLSRVRSVLVEVEGVQAGPDSPLAAPLAAAGLIEELAVRGAGSGRNRLFRRPGR